MLSPEVCEEREWILPNGLGGYSSSTVCGINSRTYHGYLVAALDPPGQRYVLLSKVEDSLVYGEDWLPLSTNRYGNTFYPAGFKYIDEFHWERNYVEWIYRFPTASVIKRLSVQAEANAVSLEYILEGEGEIRLCPLVTFRNHHVTKRSGFAYFSWSRNESGLHINRNGNRMLDLVIAGRHTVESTMYWYYNFLYRLDKERGSNHEEDLFNPFCLKLRDSRSSILFAANGTPRGELRRKGRDPIALLREASSQFVVKGKRGPAIIAGYHWFGEWARDSLISMEGTLLINNDLYRSREILQRYLDYEDRGMLPTYFDENTGEPVYKAVDVSLWWFNAAFKYLKYSGDLDFVRRNYDDIADLIHWYMKGNGTVVNREHLILHRGAPLTWMDAQYDGRVVTPREGMAVEVNALWYNSLMIMSLFAERLGQDSEQYRDEAEAVKSSFNELFRSQWGLYDYLSEDLTPDTSVRPNQIFAISLPFPVVDDDFSRVILGTVERMLLRPYGLSTLARNDPKYKPVYKGDRRQRDEAYHNGPIWPWLIGAYVDAKLKFGGDSSGKDLMPRLDPLLKFSYEMNGFLPELFDDLPPYRSRGCIAQAWSVAELLRSLVSITS